MHDACGVRVQVMAVIVWALFGILEIGNLIEEPFTATVGLGGSREHYVLPLTEVHACAHACIRVHT